MMHRYNLAAAILVWGLGGCLSLRHHRDTNAPGIADIEAAPEYGRDQPSEQGAESERPEPERPNDPGERIVTLNPGMFGSVGGRLGQPPGQRFAGSIGFELSLNRGTSPHSHYGDDFFVYPLRGYGASLGGSLMFTSDGTPGAGPVYLEVHKFRLFTGAGLGYAVDVANGAHGPQVSAWFTTIYVRMRYLFSDGFGLFVGGQLKIPIVWISSQ